MTKDFKDEFTEPMTNRKVPFFVRLASYKLLDEYLKNNGGSQVEQVSESRFNGPPRCNSVSMYSESQETWALTVRSNLRIERELKLVEEAYRKLTEESKWNPKVICLALKIIRFEIPKSDYFTHNQLSDDEDISLG